MNINEEYEFTTEEQSLTEKDWAAGSKEIMDFNELVISHSSGEAGFIDVSYSPQMHKMFDEPIVNAIDHAVKTHVLGSKNPVKQICITYNDDGSATIWNDGDGVPAVIHPEASKANGKNIYIPTLIFGRLFQGSNRKSKANLPVGGTNGIGVKITNCLSTKFELETICDGTIFKQVWEKMKSIEHEPIIRSTKVSKSYTKLSFMPNYAHFGYNSELLAASIPKLRDILYTRCCLAAIFCKQFLPHVVIKFNGAPVGITSTMLASKLFPQANTVKFTITPTNTTIGGDAKYPWDITVVIAQHKRNHISNINGIVVSDGPHFAKLIKAISAALKAKVSKELNNNTIKLPPNFVKNNVFLMINTQMIKPGWTGQRKDILSVPAKKLEDLVIPEKQMNAIVKHLMDMAVNATIDAPTKAPSGAKIEYKKYTPASDMSKKNAKNRRLILVEGDSALGQIKNGLSNTLGFADYGRMCLGGVIMNVMKQISEITRGDEIIIRRTGRLDGDHFMTEFIKIMGLNYDYKYDKNSPTYEKEMSQLTYHGIIAAVDQDMDGRGNILPIILVLFNSFWPNLLAAGFIEWFQTDIIKLFPVSKGKVLSFWNEADFEVAKKTLDMTKYKTMYYKGLGTNDNKETIAMFKNFKERLRKFVLDDESKRMFEIYYGKLSNLRKNILSRPQEKLSYQVLALQNETGEISCSDHLRQESHTYQLDNLERKLDHVMDGQNQASRKVLHGAMRYFAKNDNKPVKVAQLGGAISESESYHHGEASLFGSIKNRAFTATGGIQVVLFKPKGQYGFRSDGGVAASERYVYTALTKKVWDVLFNKLDYYLLSFREEDNTKLEPLYFVPIVPLVMLESKELPAHGWKLKIWARDVYAVIDAIKKYIEGNQAISALPPAKYAETNYPWTGEFRNIRGEPYSFGKYERYTLTDGRTLIRITELPLRVWTDSYMIWLKKQQEKYNFIESVVDCQSTTIVLIDITLSADGLRRIEGCGDSIWTDDIEEFFQLRNSMKSHINLMGIQGEVMEFRNYEEVLRFWLPKRERYYTLRIDRQLILLEIQIIVRENIIKYIEKDYTLKGMGRAKMDEFLIKEGFPPVNNVVLNSRDNFTKTEDLISTIMPDKMGGDADYKYLLNISDSNKSKESLENHYQKLAKYKKERDFILHEKSVDKFIGASTWKRELDELAAALREGGSTNWNFEEDSKYEL